MRQTTESPVDESAAPPTRRAMLATGMLAAVAALLPARAPAQTARRPRPPQKINPPLTLPDEIPVAPREWTSDTTRLLRRITMGMTDTDVAAAKRYGFRGYMERQLQYSYLDDSLADQFVAARYPLLSQSVEQLYAADATTVRNQLAESSLFRAAFSERQLYARMVEFWSDHFNISIDKVGYLKLVDDRDVIRTHALTTFRQLLYASAKSGAMMAYLDQNQSRSGAPNQNYAREIMELHTLGVDGGYTQTDVAELSRVLTGWTISGRGTFSFNPAIHDWGAKTVLGVKIPAGSPALGAEGIKEGEQMLDVLLAHPSTATFISHKLLSWLLGYDPAPAQVAAVAAVYKATGTDIKAMVRASLDATWLKSAPMKYKRPFHFVASALRSANPTVTGVTSINRQLLNVGQPLFVWETPDGYPDKVEYWAGNILPRWAFANTLTGLTTGEIVIDVAPFMRAATAEGTVAMIDARFFGGEIDPVLSATLTTYLKGGAYTAARVRESIALAMSANSFQWY